MRLEVRDALAQLKVWAGWRQLENPSFFWSIDANEDRNVRIYERRTLQYCGYETCGLYLCRCIPVMRTRCVNASSCKDSRTDQNKSVLSDRRSEKRTKISRIWHACRDQNGKLPRRWIARLLWRCMGTRGQPSLWDSCIWRIEGGECGTEENIHQTINL